jgi:hypothetical protein
MKLMSTSTRLGGGRSRWTPIFFTLLILLGAMSAQAAVLINELDCDTVSIDALEFVELYGSPNEALDGLVLVFYNGSDDASYVAYDLDGYTCDANGFFLLGNPDVVPTPTITFAGNGLQNGEDAVALYTGDGADFPNDTPVTATNLLDAIVYETNDDTDSGLLAVLTPGQPIIDENVNGNKDTESCQRSPDGGGGGGVTTSYVVQAPTPGSSNGGVLPQPPQVNSVYHRSLLPIPSEAVTVYADITDSDGTLTTTDIHYQVDGGGYGTVAMTLDTGDTYTGTIPGAADGSVVDYYVSATDDEAQTTTNPSDAPVSFYTYTVAPETLTPIASVHADSAGFDGTTIMIQAQVYIPGNHQADGTSVSAYVQDASGRGLNIYGTYYSTGADLLNDTSNIVKITGRVDYYFTTLELVSYEVELVSTGNPVLTPTIKTTANAALPVNEGTYTGTTGPITAIATTGGGNPAHNFTINDGTGDVVIRIDDDVVVGVDTWLIGDELVAAGAGGTYASQGQIIVGLATDITNNGQAADTTPPTLTSATLTASTTVTLLFDEPIDATTGDNAANYEVYETATPANTIAVTTALVQGDPTYVVLTLAASPSGTPHTVRINNVEDQHSNPIAANTTAGIDEPVLLQLVINEIMQNPYVVYDSGGEWFEVYNADAVAIDMNGWTIADNDFDSHVIDNGGPLVINPGEYKVFCVNADTMAAESVPVFYQYTGITLGNGADELILYDTALNEVDIVAYDGGITFPDPTGKSMQFVDGDNNIGDNWNAGGSTFGTGDQGTPGAANYDFTGVEDTPVLATTLGRNYPNPFNPKTSFSFMLDRADHVSLRVFDMRGRQIRTIVDGNLAAGDYTNVYNWDGRDQSGRPVNSGTYFYRLTTGSGYTQAMKMTLLK